LHAFFVFVLLTLHIHNLCNENKPDAIFILNLFRQTTSICLGRIYCPSSGGIHCIQYVQQLVHVARLGDWQLPGTQEMYNIKFVQFVAHT
jgi:hypothetical protein